MGKHVLKSSLRNCLIFSSMQRIFPTKNKFSKVFTFEDKALDCL